MVKPLNWKIGNYTSTRLEEGTGLTKYMKHTKKTNKKATVMSHEIKSDDMEQNKDITLKNGVRVEQIYGNHFFKLRNISQKFSIDNWIF